MASYTETFKRKEMKYVLTRSQMERVVAGLRGRMAPDEFGRTYVQSLYYDTPQRSLIARSVEKPLYKEKLRQRWYGEGSDGVVFTEMKKKFDGIVYKRRVATSAQAAQAWVDGMPYKVACARFPLADPAAQADALSARSMQIAREIDAMRGRSGILQPSALIACERTAFVPVADDVGGAPTSDLRITFDENLRGTDLLAAGEPSPLLPNDHVIMEIKSTGPLPLWLVRTLSECGARPSSFSKYGELYKRVA